MKIKIIRSIIDQFNTHVYMWDDICGVAIVQKSAFEAYVEALECINNFENEVDRQYREAGYE